MADGLSAVSNEISIRAAGDTDLAASITALNVRCLRQQGIIISDDGIIEGLIPREIVSDGPTCAEFDALLARLAAAEAEIETLKGGRGPEPEGVL